MEFTALRVATMPYYDQCVVEMENGGFDRTPVLKLPQLANHMSELSREIQMYPVKTSVEILSSIPQVSKQSESQSYTS